MIKVLRKKYLSDNQIEYKINKNLRIEEVIVFNKKNKVYISKVFEICFILNNKRTVTANYPSGGYGGSGRTDEFIINIKDEEAVDMFFSLFKMMEELRK